MPETVNIGDKVRDTITRAEGIAIARTVWINGCVRVTVQPEGFKDGKMFEAFTADEPQLKVLKRAAHPAVPEQTPEPERAHRRNISGGPRDDATALRR